MKTLLLRLTSSAFILAAGLVMGILLGTYGINYQDALSSEWYMLLPSVIYVILAVGCIAFGVLLRYFAKGLPKSSS